MRKKIDVPTFLAAMALMTPAIGCMTTDDGGEDGPHTVVVGEDTDGKRDTSAGDRTATVLGFTLTMNAHAIVGADGTTQTVVLKGTTSRTITNVFSYVPDDGFGTATLTGAKTFEILLDEPYEINTILSGLPLLVVLDTLTGSPRHFDAQITMAPRFARFEGTTRIVVDPVIRPIYVNDPIDNLRYRGRFTTTSDHTSPEVTAFDAGDPVVTQRGPRETTFDWQFGPFSEAYDPPTDPMTMRGTFVNAPVIATKHAGIDLKVVKLGLTTDDPYEVWPSVCTEPVAECMLADPDAPDFAACGDYRDVLPCTHGGLCEFASQPVELTPIDASQLDDEVAAFNVACDRGFTWCSLDEVRAFTVPECPDQEVTPELLFQLLADQRWTDDNYGYYAEDPDLHGSLFFSNGYSSAGPALETAVDGLAGTTFARGFIGSIDYPCHNCHNFYARTIVYYPSTRTVVVLDGNYGYDS